MLPELLRKKRYSLLRSPGNILPVKCNTPPTKYSIQLMYGRLFSRLDTFQHGEEDLHERSKGRCSHGCSAE